jgi:DNA-binding transcriptional LysR family regulator
MFFAKHELPIPASRVTAKSLQAICALLPDTDLIALLPEYVVRDDVAAKRLVRIPYQQIVLTNKAGLVTTKGRQATGAAAVLAKALRQVCRQRA